MSEPNHYKHLEPHTGSRFRQLFLKGRKLSAEALYRETVGEEPRTPEEVAQDFEVPVEAVFEAIDYCSQHEDLLRQEQEEELARIRKFEKKYPPVQPPDYLPAS
jgi:hypothetical protein